MKGNSFLILGVGCLLSAPSAQATTEFRELYRGARAQAMGNAFVAVADDEQAIFYNPAGLAGLDGFKLNLLPVDIDITKDTVLKYADTLAGFRSFSAASFNTLFGNNHALRAQLTPSFAMQNFGIAYLTDFQGSLRVRNKSMPQIEIGYMTTNGFQTAMGFSLAGRKKRKVVRDFRAGVAVKVLNRRGGNNVLGVTDLLALSTDTLKRISGGFDRGTGADLGLMYVQSFAKRFELKLGGAFTEMGNIYFGALQNPVVGNLSIGSSIKYNMGSMYLLGAYDYRHMLETADWRKKSHLGFELGMPFVKAQLGLNQIFLTYGLGVDLWLFKAHFLSYAEETAAIVGQDPESRYMAMVSFGLNF